VGSTRPIRFGIHFPKVKKPPGAQGPGSEAPAAGHERPGDRPTSQWREEGVVMQTVLCWARGSSRAVLTFQKKGLSKWQGACQEGRLEPPTLRPLPGEAPHVPPWRRSKGLPGTGRGLRAESRQQAFRFPARPERARGGRKGPWREWLRGATQAAAMPAGLRGQSRLPSRKETAHFSLGRSRGGACGAACQRAGAGTGVQWHT